MSTTDIASDQKINLVLIEDHAIFRKGFIALVHTLEQRFHFAYEAANGLEFIERFPNYPLPDIVITDLRMQKMDGFEVIDWLNNRYPKIPVIALTMYNEPAILLRLLAMGVKGVIYKDNIPGNIIQAFDAVLSGDVYFTEIAEDAFIEAYPEDEDDYGGVGVMPNMNKTMRLFAMNLTTEFTLKEVALNMNISEKTAERYRSLLFAMLGVKNRIGYMALAIKRRIFRKSKY